MIQKIPRKYASSALPGALSGALSGFALILVHFLYLREVPGFQIDEAWASIFGYQIAFKPHYWPVQVASPYTSALVHYLAAGVFKVFGVSLLAYRVPPMLEVIAGVAFMSAALLKIGEKRAALLLPAVIAFFPALVINQRWPVDSTTFHVLCVGMVALGLAMRFKTPQTRWGDFWWIAGIVLGVMTHILFLGPALALWACLFFNSQLESRRNRIGIILCVILLIPFYGVIISNEPDHLRAAGPLLISLALAVFHILPLSWTRPLAKARNWLLLPFVLVGCLILIPFTIFIEGTWLEIFSNGYLVTRFLIGLSFIPVLLTLFFLRKHEVSTGFRRALWILPLSLLLIYLMVIKPGPRYLEIPFLFCAVLLALGFARLKTSELRWAMGLWILIGGAQLGLNYFKVAVAEAQEDHVVQVWRWHDGSYGFLPKLRLMRRLQREGCSINDLGPGHPHEPFVELAFLSYGSDWPTPKISTCRFGHQMQVRIRDMSRPEDQVERPDLGRYFEGPFKIEVH